MTHPRKTIRTSVVALLDTAGIVAAGRVHSNRVLQISSDELPALSVYAIEEESDFGETGDLVRKVDVAVEGICKASIESGVDDALDDMAEDIEAALDAAWGAPVVEATLKSTSIEHKVECEQPTGHVRLVYSATYVS